MTEEHSTILDAVQNINTDLYKQLGDDTVYVLSITLEPAAGYQCIEWMGGTIWHSQRIYRWLWWVQRRLRTNGTISTKTDSNDTTK